MGVFKNKQQVIKTNKVDIQNCKHRHTVDIGPISKCLDCDKEFSNQLYF